MAYMTGRINLSISEEKLAQLIRKGSLCAADFSCLDHQSKQKVLATLSNMLSKSYKLPSMYTNKLSTN